MTAISILVAGCGGRMGRAVVAQAVRTPGVTLAGGFERPESPAIGEDIGHIAGLDGLGLTVEDSFVEGMKRASALIDFTAPGASLENARACAEAGVAHVVGTTGFTPEQEAEIHQLAEQTPIVKSGNMSLGVNLLAALVEQAAAKLSEEYDIEILDIHHRMKTDAPSGTALMLGEAAAKGRGVTLAEKSVHVRDGQMAPRTPGDIGFAVIRAGGIVGEHKVHFAGAEEIVTLSHAAIDRALFAKGAIAAACWASGRKPGLYSMRDVLGL